MVDQVGRGSGLEGLRWLPSVQVSLVYSAGSAGSVIDCQLVKEVVQLQHTSIYLYLQWFLLSLNHHYCLHFFINRFLSLFLLLLVTFLPSLLHLLGIDLLKLLEMLPLRRLRDMRGAGLKIHLFLNLNPLLYFIVLLTHQFQDRRYVLFHEFAKSILKWACCIISECVLIDDVLSDGRLTLSTGKAQAIWSMKHMNRLFRLPHCIGPDHTDFWLDALERQALAVWLYYCSISSRKSMRRSRVKRLKIGRVSSRYVDWQPRRRLTDQQTKRSSKV